MVEREKVDSLGIEKWVASEFVIFYICDLSLFMCKSPIPSSGIVFC